ncbi:MFS transporter [Pilimelia terevasa]|uniref:MFS transporter n=1 Tax=Pilimelia terevasa TaxID=53372 RepID=A0A8J3BMC2_9ACTN|nr:MFS transporter [Pilimelia terevasa]GGK24830.1 MFS transporter [Pilimelia terevasa]
MRDSREAVAAPPPDDTRGHRDGGPPVRPVVVQVAVFGAFAAQQTLTPVLPPLARQLGLGEAGLGLLIAGAAAVVMAASPVWGRQVGRSGYRATMLSALGLAAVGAAAFAVAVRLGLAGVVTGAVLWAALIAGRALVFGAGIAGLPVAAQSYVAASIEEPAARTRALGMVGAAQGLALIVGPLIGGALGGLSLFAPLYATPVLVLATAAVVALRLPAGGVPAARRVSARVSWRERRLWPYLCCGVGVLVALGMVQVTIGFLIQDRLHATHAETARLTGLALVSSGVGYLAAQAGLVRLLKWSPRRLVTVGALLAAGGAALVAGASGMPAVLAGMAAVGVGLGLAVPGYTTGATLGYAPAQQGAVAGLVGAANAAAFIVGPIAGTALYQWQPAAAPVAACAILLGAAFLPAAAAPPRHPVGGARDGDPPS